MPNLDTVIEDKDNSITLFTISSDMSPILSTIYVQLELDLPTIRELTKAELNQDVQISLVPSESFEVYKKIVNHMILKLLAKLKIVKQMNINRPK